ncbi:YrhB domain-containing protein [Streptomyces litchfieldiae]|uniref:YrhB domain-containing protein n=1 Tax=Streptomyces litchfieldiae TaxID=3075543 RepID=A0ABU2MMZ9_9ACTN|nr:YrhB domain-containing protein [Streptomyces sp. DSM 44938]MDT0342718.1 YrhB domain-containing protein [Streptomyces sp. DSM 44938]
MISCKEALRVALEHLQNVYEGEGYTFVMLPNLTKEYRTIWAVAFDTQEHLDTGDMTKAPMTRVLMVPKDGSQPHFPPSARPVIDYVEQLEGPQ